MMLRYPFPFLKSEPVDSVLLTGSDLARLENYMGWQHTKI